MALCLRAAGLASLADAGTALPPDLQIVNTGSHRMLVGNVALPVQEQERMQRDMYSLMDGFQRTLRDRLTSYSFQHPSRGTPLYNHLALDGTQEHNLEYYEARNKAARVADAFAPRIGQFFDAEVRRSFEELDRGIHDFANRHIQDLAEQRAYGYVISPKYTALKTAANDIATAIMNGPALSYDPVFKTLSKIPVNSYGINAAVEGMQNRHKVDEYQVACAVAKQLADFAEGYTQNPWNSIHEGVQRRIRQTETVEIPLQDAEL